MTLQNSRNRSVIQVLLAIGVLAIAVAAVASRQQWLPYLDFARNANGPEPAAPPAHPSHDVPVIIKLSDKGLKNIGYEPFVIGPSDYQRSLTLPAIVVERPGRSQIHITAPLTGNIMTIHAVDGEAVEPGAPMFEMQLTHEELVTAQRDYLAASANLEIVNRETKRLEALGEGIIAGKRILEQQYERQKLEAALLADEQAMLLHGLNKEQIKQIRESRQLFRSLTVYAPAHTDTDEACLGPHLFTVQRLGVAKGEQVEVGRELAVLSDHCELQVEGLAFEDDAPQIRRAAESGKRVTARLLKGNSPSAVVEGLAVLYVADQIDPNSRALKVYLSLPNDVALDRTAGDKRFLEWRYKPGQRMQISIPVETWENQIVVPTNSVVDEGAEIYVYRQNGDYFEQVPVHVVHRDQNAVVLANDGALFPGDIVAGNGAFLMHQAIKNQAGGGVDPHAGHNH